MRSVAVFACLALGAIVGGCASAPSGGTTPASVATPAHGVDAFTLLRDAADHEALYTLAGGLKPVSTGVWRGSYEVSAPDLEELRAVREALGVLRTEEWYADVQVFDASFEGERFLSAYVVHREALARMIERFGPFWGPLGVTPCAHPAEVLAVVDRLPKGERWRGYGYLFGYPAGAVDFFVEAGLAAEEGGEVGPGKDRRFVQIPTYASETGRFTYAVALESEPGAGDEALAEAAAALLEDYTRRRGGMRDVPSALAGLRLMNERFEGVAIRAAVIRDGGERAGAGAID